VLFAFRDVVRQLDSKDVHLLRTVPVQFRTASGQQMGCSKLVITGIAAQIFAHMLEQVTHSILPLAQLLRDTRVLSPQLLLETQLLQAL